MNEQTSSRDRSSSQPHPRVGYLIIVLCVLVVAGALTISQRIDQRPLPSPAYAVAPSSLTSSSTWRCPISGSGSDLIMLANPDERTSHAEISVYDGDGARVSIAKKAIKPKSTLSLSAQDLGATAATWISVDTYDSSVVAFRSLALSDGEELVACTRDSSSHAVISQLETIRNSSATLVLINPGSQSIVIDIAATLTDGTADPPLTTIDDERGVILAPHARVNLDVQQIFGRYTRVSLVLTSRSGSFVTEAMQTYSGARSITGQTIVSPAETVTRSAGYLTGVNPTALVSRNGSRNTYGIQVDAYGVGGTSLTPETQSATSASTLNIDLVGNDFGARALSLVVPKSVHAVKDLAVSWVRAVGTAVSSGTVQSQASNNIFVPVAATDQLAVYNPQSSSTDVTINVYGTKKTITQEVKGHSFVLIDLTELELTSSAITHITSTRDISVASTNSTGSRYVSGVNVVQ